MDNESQETPVANVPESALVRAALGLPETADSQTVVSAIAQLKAVDKVDPEYKKLYDEKIGAGLPPTIAKIATEKQLKHDAQLRAKALEEAKAREAAAAAAKAKATEDAKIKARAKAEAEAEIAAAEEEARAEVAAAAKAKAKADKEAKKNAAAPSIAGEQQ